MQAEEPLTAPDTTQFGTTRGPAGRIRRLLGLVWTRFLFRWGAFFGFIVSVSNCPFCGRQGCPQGIATAGVAGGVVAALTTLGRRSGSRTQTPIDDTIRRGL